MFHEDSLRTEPPACRCESWAQWLRGLSGWPEQDCFPPLSLPASPQELGQCSLRLGEKAGAARWRHLVGLVMAGRGPNMAVTSDSRCVVKNNVTVIIHWPGTSSTSGLPGGYMHLVVSYHLVITIPHCALAYTISTLCIYILYQMCAIVFSPWLFLSFRQKKGSKLKRTPSLEEGVDDLDGQGHLPRGSVHYSK